MLTDLEHLTEGIADRYRIERELGRGGMATVYLATDLRHNRPVALKVLRPEIAYAVGSDRFLREIAVTARLEHPSIVPLLDSGSVRGLLYYVMPYVDGESLRDRLSREKQLPVADVLTIAHEVADALGYAHSHGVVHRDIKPENILLSGSHARVADFGIARAITAAGGDALTATGLAVGTVTYMSPEQAVGMSDVDGRSDLYSLGCVVYEMLAGEPPFSSANPQALIARKSMEQPRPLRPVRPTVPANVERAVLIALAPVPADRFATASDFSRALERAVSARGILAPRTRHSHGRLVVWTSLTLLAIAAALGIWWLGWTDVGLSKREISPTRIAVFPFAVDDPELAYLREGMMDLVGNAIDGTGEIRRVDPFILTGELRKGGDTTSLDLQSASRVSRELGAGRFLLGRVVVAGQSMMILASLYVSTDQSRLEYKFAHDGPLDSLSGLVHALARDILLHVQGGPGTWVTTANAPPTIRYEALREYSRGEALMRRGQTDSAAAAFLAALSFDSTFALGWLRLSFAENFRLNDAGMLASIDRAMRFVEQLGRRDSMLAEVVHLHAHADAEGAERTALALVSDYPEYAEAWFRLAQAQHWSSWRTGRPPRYAEAAVASALSLDPGHRQALHLQGWLAALNGQRARARTLNTQAWGQPGWYLLPEKGHAFDTFQIRATSLPTGNLIYLINSSAWNSEDRLGEASRLAALLTDSIRRPDEDRKIGRLLRARIEAAGGRWSGAESAYREVDGGGIGLGALEAGWFAAVPLLEVGAEKRQAIRDSLALWKPSVNSDILARSRSRGALPGLLFPEPWLVPHARHYALGLLSASLRDEGEALRYAKMLQNSAEPSDSIGLLHDLSLEIRAHLLLRRDQPAAALAILDSSGMRLASSYQAVASMFHMRPVTRLLRAEALAAMGRHREAIGWYEGIAFAVTPEYVFLAGTSLRKGELYELLGEPTRAAYHYRRFIARWQYADSAHQPLVQEVRRRLLRLDGKA